MKKFFTTILKGLAYVLLINVVLVLLILIVDFDYEAFLKIEGILFSLCSFGYFIIKKRNTVKWLFPILIVVFESAIYFILKYSLGEYDYKYVGIWFGTIQLLITVAFLVAIDIVVMLIGFVRKKIKNSKIDAQSQFGTSQNK